MTAGGSLADEAPPLTLVEWFCFNLLRILRFFLHVVCKRGSATKAFFKTSGLHFRKHLFIMDTL